MLKNGCFELIILKMLAPIFYVIPEDGDDIKQMNCFTIRKEPAKVTLQDVRENFPVAGAYHFRFQF
jgi:hypothetical protein